MSIAVVDSFQSVHVKEQQGKLPARAFTSLDLQIQHIHKVPIVSQTGQRIACCLTAEVILQLPSPGDVFGDNLVGFELAMLAEDVAAGEPHRLGGMVFPLPLYFEGLNLSTCTRLTQLLCSSAE